MSSNQVASTVTQQTVPVQAQFGDIVRIDLDSPQCDLIEAEVTTNLGKTSYSF